MKQEWDTEQVLAHVYDVTPWRRRRRKSCSPDECGKGT